MNAGDFGINVTLIIITLALLGALAVIAYAVNDSH